ncbi:MAG: hypothetical protein R3B46_01825 [Phycisphaerales bacterium]|nr:hypothetical protein [Phycisphaerales bacterium]
MDASNARLRIDYQGGGLSIGRLGYSIAAGIRPATVEESARYIDDWRRKISADPKLVVHAAGAGQRAADRILGTRAAEPG